VLWIISRTHWEGAVFKTREEYLEMGLGNISTALQLLGEIATTQLWGTASAAQQGQGSIESEFSARPSTSGPAR
jgi:hypothetical protein